MDGPPRRSVCHGTESGLRHKGQVEKADYDYLH